MECLKILDGTISSCTRQESDSPKACESPRAPTLDKGHNLTNPHSESAYNPQSRGFSKTPATHASQASTINLVLTLTSSSPKTPFFSLFPSSSLHSLRPCINPFMLHRAISLTPLGTFGR